MTSLHTSDLRWKELTERKTALIDPSFLLAFQMQLQLQLPKMFALLWPDTWEDPKKVSRLMHSTITEDSSSNWHWHLSFVPSDPRKCVLYNSLYHCKSSQSADPLMLEELRGSQSISSNMWLRRSLVFKRAAHWSVKITFDIWVTSELCEMKAEITLLTSMNRAINTEVCKNTLLNAFVLEAKMCVATNQNKQILQNNFLKVISHPA